MNKVTEQVLAAVTVDGVVDHETLKTVWMEIGEYRQKNKEAAKEAAKASKEATKAELAERGKAYFGTLKEGDRIAYTMANGSVVEGTVGKMKEGAKRAHIVLDVIPESTSKKPTADRYVDYSQINVPEDFVAENSAEAVA